MIRILILGGYGNFGSYIARTLAGDERMQLLIAGRSSAKAQAFVATLQTANPAEAYAIDIGSISVDRLRSIRPDLVIHTVGPFQRQDYAVAKACIAAGCHYADLADARAFVTGIGSLDEAARASDCLVVAGASSVPALTAAIIDDAAERFSTVTEIDYGISAAQQTNRGLGTASAILSYVGRPFTQLRAGRWAKVWGWQELHWEYYPGLGLRLFGNCDIPDADLFPARYVGLQTLRFAAGHEIKLLHLGTWLLSWIVRSGLARSLAPWSGPLLRASFLFDPIGSDRSGFHMFLKGVGRDGRPREERVYILARSGHGPLIPCMPPILLARRLAAGQLSERGARPCVDLVGLREYLSALDGLDIEVKREVIT